MAEAAVASVGRRSAEEIHDLAMQMVRREIWLMWATDLDVLMCFPAIVLAAEATNDAGERIYTDEYWASVGGVFEEIRKAAPRSVNGKPMFFGVQFIHVEDCTPLMCEYERLEAALKREGGGDART